MQGLIIFLSKLYFKKEFIKYSTYSIFTAAFKFWSIILMYILVFFFEIHEVGIIGISVELLKDNNLQIGDQPNKF